MVKDIAVWSDSGTIELFPKSYSEKVKVPVGIAQLIVQCGQCTKVSHRRVWQNSKFKAFEVYAFNDQLTPIITPVRSDALHDAP